MSDGPYDVAVVGVDGAQRHLTEAGILNVASIDECDLSTATFDESTHTWILPNCRAQIVLTNQTRCGRDNLAAYLGVAVHGVPNYFTVSSNDAEAGGQLAYITDCLKLMRRTGSTRIEVLYSTQRLSHMRGADEAVAPNPRHRRRMCESISAGFDLSSHTGVESGLYDGAAVIRIDDDERRARVRLTGRLDPIDGRYHWQGTVFDELPVQVRTQNQQFAVMIGERSANGRITERTSQGRYSVAGVGPPPYALAEVEVVVPGR